MGSHKIKTIDLSVEADEKEQKKSTKKTPKKKTPTIPKDTKTSVVPDSSETPVIQKPVQKCVRSKKYVSARAQVDRTQTYPLIKAIELVKKTSYSHFPGTVTADLVVKDDKVKAQVSFPYSIGRQTRVVIADDKLLTQIEKGHLDFDVLLATPAMMPKLAKLAKILGPKGLMPNPKTNTITDKPEQKKKELEAGKTLVKTEKKAPLIHQVIGKTNQPDQQLKENTEALINAINPRKIIKLVLAATMSPGVKVDISEFITT
jgi:large subunit ribosomal protein L1